MMILLFLSQVLSIIWPTSTYNLYAYNLIYAIVTVIICYIVSAHSQRRDNPLFIEFQEDGNVKFWLGITVATPV
jgi:hypothetical protein